MSKKKLISNLTLKKICVNMQKITEFGEITAT